MKCPDRVLGDGVQIPTFLCKDLHEISRSTLKNYVWNSHPLGVGGGGGINFRKSFTRYEMKCLGLQKKVMSPTPTQCGGDGGSGSITKRFSGWELHVMCRCRQKLCF